MKIAVTYENERIYQHFGHTAQFKVYTVEDGKILSEEIVDTNGSGDVFHGAFAAGLVKGFDFDRCCRFASAVSALKCTGIGARESVPDFDTVKKFLEVNGYDL